MTKTKQSKKMAAVPEYCSHIFKEPSNKASLSLKSEYEVLDLYRNTTDEYIKREMLDELLSRHKDLLRRLAWNMFSRYSERHGFEDFVQHAVVGAMLAYNRFDFSKSNNGKNRLSTYVYATVEKYLLDAINQDSFIQCPSHQRAMRSYLTGKYDLDQEKKLKFEQENGLTDEASRDLARQKYIGLTPEIVSFENELFNQNNSSECGGSFLDLICDNRAASESDLINRMEIERAVEFLSPRQKMVCDLIMYREHTVPSVADILTDQLGTTVTTSMVRSDIRAIRKAFQSVA
jgi:RNA polymerase sigma factor (sigma-70 family)